MKPLSGLQMFAIFGQGGEPIKTVSRLGSERPTAQKVAISLLSGPRKIIHPCLRALSALEQFVWIDVQHSQHVDNPRLQALGLRQTQRTLNTESLL